MSRIQRHRAASGQGRGQRDPVRRAGRDPAPTDSTAVTKAATPHAKAPPSPRKAEPARAAQPADRPKAVKPEAIGKARQKPRLVRTAPELARDEAPPSRPNDPAKGRRPARHGLSGPPRPADAPAAAPSIPRRKPTGAPRYIAFHKPYGVLSQFTAESGHRALAEFALPPDVYAAGRLDMDSEGLLLLSNDGTFINRLLSPHHGHERTYLVQVEGEPDDAALAALRAGVKVRDYTTRPALVEKLDEAPALPPRDPPIRERRHIPTTWLRITLTEGRNRQVRRMTAAVGHPTLRLVRVAIGALDLGDLPRGQWREVRRKDILPRG